MQYFRPSDIMDKILSGSKLADLKLNSDLQKLIEDIAKKKFTESNNFDNVSPNNKYKILHDLKVKLIAEQKKANKYERVQPSKTNSVFLNNKITQYRLSIKKKPRISNDYNPEIIKLMESNNLGLKQKFQTQDMIIRELILSSPVGVIPNRLKDMEPTLEK